MSNDEIDVPHVYNLLPLLSGGKANRTTPIGRFEIPQRFWRPIMIGAAGGLLAMSLDFAFGRFIVSWWFPILLGIAVAVIRWRSRNTPNRTAVRFWTTMAVLVWVAFPLARIIGWGLGVTPVVGGFLDSLGWPALGAVLMVVSSEARTKSGSNRAEAILATGRSTNLAGQLHLGLWPVPDVPAEVRWCDGGVPNPLRRRR